MNKRTPKNQALKRAIKKAGSQVKLAAEISNEIGEPGKIKQGHVWWWLYESGQVTPAYARVIERLYGEPRCELNPAAYPPEEYAA